MNPEKGNEQMRPIVLAVMIVWAGVNAQSGEVSTPPAQLHFQPEGGVLGDIIPFFWEGTYHVYYLKGSSWGHLASSDLLHWEHKPDALQKGEGSTSPDGENCWTGSIVEHQGTFHLFYTGKNSADPLGDQKVMMATSPDLVTWTKHPEWTFYADGKIYWSKPVNGAIDDKLIYHHQAFRDPEVFWNAKDENWWMLLHAALADGSSPAFGLYASNDLIHWEPRQPLLVYPKSVSGDCPHLFEMEGAWYLLGADRHYTWADKAAGPFSPEMMPYEWGELFVPKTMQDGYRRILLGWIGHRQGDTDSGQPQWGGVLCMPRELFADSKGQLRERPAHEVVGAFKRTVLDQREDIQQGEWFETPADIMMHVRFQPMPAKSEVVLAFRQTKEDPTSGYRLRISPASSEVELSGKHASYKCKVNFDGVNPVRLHLFVVGNVCECFVDDTYCLTMRIYDYPQGGVSFPVIKGGAGVARLTVKGWGG